MFSARRFIQFAFKNIALVLLGVFIATLGQAAATPVATARVAPDQTHAAGSTTQATAVQVSCVPIGIMTYAIRVHVQCQTAISGISYFAVATSDGAYAARVLSVITAAQVAGRTLAIQYDPADTSGAAIGCQAASCRLATAVGFGQ